MSQGVFVDGRRPASKKAIKEALAADPSRVELEGTSMFGNEYSGPVLSMPESTTAYFVGPDPYTSRKFYGQIVRKGDKVTVR